MVDKIEFNGLLLIDKHSDISSFGIISRLRYLTGIKKIGHCGTLDPFASGLLPVLFGRYTKLAKYFESSDKTYSVKFVLGLATDTMDKTGKFVQQINPQELRQRIDSGELAHTLNKIVKTELSGEIEQIPPMYSAIKVAGKPLYKYAREGESIARKSRKITIYHAEISEIFFENEKWVCQAEIKCSKGTYIRSWIDDLGKKANCLAYAESLNRSACGNLNLGEKSFSIDSLMARFEALNEDQAKLRNEIADNYFYSIKDAFAEFPLYNLNLTEAKKVIYGQALQLEDVDLLSSASLIQLIYNEELLAVVSFDPTKSNYVKYERVLADRL